MSRSPTPEDIDCTIPDDRWTRAAKSPPPGKEEHVKSHQKRLVSRASKACQQCRLRKARCDNKQPRCGGCARRGTPCVYLNDDRRKSGSKMHVARLEARVQDLESRGPVSIASDSTIHPPPSTISPFPFSSSRLSPPLSSLPMIIPTSSFATHTSPNQSPPQILETLASPTLPSLTPPAQVDFAESFGATVQHDLDSTDGTRTPCGRNSSTLASQITGVKGHMSIADGGQLRWFGATSSRHLSFGVLALSQFRVETAQTVSVKCVEALERQGHSLHPNDRLEDRLLSLYFAWHNPFFHVVQEYLFRSHRRRYLDGEPDHPYFSWSLYFAILAYAAPLSDEALAAKDPTHEDPGDNYMLQARICLDHEMDSPQETTMQALALMAAREVSCGRDARGWMYIAMAASCAIDLGLHQDALEWVDRRKMSLEQYGARNNLWWGVYAYASLWGLYVGRPSLFQGQDVTCAHPSLRPESSFSRDLSTLLQITNTMTQELYSGTQFMAAPSLSTGECHKRLLEWHGGLASNNSLDAELNPVPSPHVILLHLQFYVSMLLLHRPFLVNGCAGIDFDISCTACASVACLLEIYRQSFGFQRISVVAVHQIFTTATTLVYVIYSCDETQAQGIAPPPITAGARNNLLICLAALSALASKQLHARRSYLSLVVLMKRWHVTLDDPSHAAGLSTQPTLASSNLPEEQFRWLSHSLYQMSTEPDRMALNGLLDLPVNFGDAFMTSGSGISEAVEDGAKGSGMVSATNPKAHSFFDPDSPTNGDAFFTLPQWDGPSLGDLFEFN